VKGVTLMRGYYKVAPEQVFDADGYFHTQDGGWLDEEGALHWTGRLSNLIKTGGANVSPVEIQELLEGYSGLRLGIPIGIDHPTLGEAVVLCAVAAEGATPDEEAIRIWLRERLAAYKVPRRVLFFRADELSYTANQKVQVEPLRARGAASPARRARGDPGPPIRLIGDRQHTGNSFKLPVAGSDTPSMELTPLGRRRAGAP
jgi:acyl-CoA synthetase (AMP-forming)/AMP-acid ligase II